MSEKTGRSAYVQFVRDDGGTSRTPCRADPITHEVYDIIPLDERVKNRGWILYEELLLDGHREELFSLKELDANRDTAVEAAGSSYWFDESLVGYKVQYGRKEAASGPVNYYDGSRVYENVKAVSVDRKGHVGPPETDFMTAEVAVSGKPVCLHAEFLVNKADPDWNLVPLMLSILHQGEALGIDASRLTFSLKKTGNSLKRGRGHPASEIEREMERYGTTPDLEAAEALTEAERAGFSEGEGYDQAVEKLSGYWKMEREDAGFLVGNYMEEIPYTPAVPPAGLYFKGYEYLIKNTLSVSGKENEPEASRVAEEVLTKDYGADQGKAKGYVKDYLSRHPYGEEKKEQSPLPAENDRGGRERSNIF